MGVIHYLERMLINEHWYEYQKGKFTNWNKKFLLYFFIFNWIASVKNKIRISKIETRVKNKKDHWKIETNRKIRWKCKTSVTFSQPCDECNDTDIVREHTHHGFPNVCNQFTNLLFSLLINQFLNFYLTKRSYLKPKNYSSNNFTWNNEIIKIKKYCKQ